MLSGGGGCAGRSVEGAERLRRVEGQEEYSTMGSVLYRGDGGGRHVDGKFYRSILDE